MGRYDIAYGGVPAHEVAGGVPSTGRLQQLPAGAQLAQSYVPAPGEKPMCVGKLVKDGSACSNVATDGPHCAGHARQAAKQRKV